MSKIAALQEAFDPGRISWRVGPTNRDKTKGMALAYIDARDVMQRLDDVCGIEGWQCDYPHAGTKTVCRIGLKFGDEWIWKSDGAGDSEMEAEKGALSDSFKRSAVRWGIGRYLYDVPATWVEIEPMGKSYKIKESEFAKLRGVLVRGYRAPDDKPAISDSALDYCSAIDACMTLKALDSYGKTTLAAKAKGLPKDQYEVVKAHFDSRVKALQQAEGLAA
jgi:hypothetical protein